MFSIFNFWNNFWQTDSNNRTEDSTNNGIDNIDVDVADNNSDSSSSIHVDSYSDMEEHITSAVYSYCGTEILASYNEDDIYLFDALGRSNFVLRNYSGHINRMTGISFYLFK